MLFDDLPAHAQAKSGAASTTGIWLLGRVERFKYQTQPFRWDAYPAVRDAQFDHLRSRILADLDAQQPAARHGLPGIDEQVEQNLFDLRRHDFGLRLAVILL